MEGGHFSSVSRRFLVALRVPTRYSPQLLAVLGSIPISYITSPQTPLLPPPPPYVLKSLSFIAETSSGPHPLTRRNMSGFTLDVDPALRIPWLYDVCM